MVGRFAQQVTDVAIFYAGLGGCLIGALHYIGWIKVQTQEIIDDVVPFCTNVTQKVEYSTSWIWAKTFMIRHAPILGGLSTGFYTGFFGGSPI